MDKFSKVVFTIIAVSLMLIAVKLWESRDTQAGFLGNGPTLGDLRAIREIKDTNKRQKAFTKLQARIPLVYVRGGRINADVD